ncbi:MAG: sigma-70 family RNA polymerase sigma factor [Anditalea sp.]
MDQPDKVLLENFRKGDNYALDQIYEYYRIPIIRFTISIIKDEQEAENIYHEVFMKILKRRGDIKPELNFNSYIFTAVKNEVFDYLKEMKKSQILKERLWEKVQSYQDEEENKEEALNQLENIVKTLSPKRRRILEMSYFERKSYHEISEALMISKNTVKNQLVKAKFIIRRKME